MPPELDEVMARENDWPGPAGCLESAYAFAPLSEFLTHPFPAAQPLLGEPGVVYLAVGSLLLVYGAQRIQNPLQAMA